MTGIRNWPLVALAALAAAVPAGAQLQPALVADIRPGPDGSLPDRAVDLGGVLFFFADDGVHGAEPWRSDGTAGGTSMILDVNPGPAGSAAARPAGAPAPVLTAGGFAWFAADDGAGGAELWRSDGTPGGTSRVKDIRPGPVGSNPAWLTWWNGLLWFQADDGANGIELWSSDGSDAGTAMLVDIYPGALAFLPPFSSNPSYLTVAGPFLVFQATNAAAGTELFGTDGTAGGTFLVLDVYTGGGFPFGQPNSGAPRDLVELNGSVYFVATDAAGAELWVTDGSVSGTFQVSDINPAPGAGSDPAELAAAGGLLFFSANDGTSGREPWRSDGTGTGTFRLADVDPAGSGFAGALGALGGAFLFSGADPVSGRQLWRSDGSTAGTFPLTAAGTAPAGLDPRDGVTVSGVLLFRAIAPGSACDLALWRSDGTAGGTAGLGTILAQGAPCDPALHAHRSLTRAGTRLFFRAGDTGGAAGVELGALSLALPPAAAVVLGVGCGVGVGAPVLTVTAPLLGHAFSMSGSGFTPGSAGGLFVSVGPPVPFLFGPGCGLFVNLATYVLLAPVIAGPAGDWAGLTLNLPLDPGLAGVPATLQAATFGTPSPFGADITNGVAIVLGTW